MTDVQLLKPDQASLEGIGGWLALPLIGLFLLLLQETRSLIVDVLPALEAETWAGLTTPGSPAYTSWWAPYIVISTIECVGFIAWGAILIVLFFMRKRQVPLLMALLYFTASAAALFELLSTQHLASQLPGLDDGSLVSGAVSGLIRSLIASAIWIPYFFRSVRVHNTFVR
jgi:hypothetical protein